MDRQVEYASLIRSMYKNQLFVRQAKETVIGMMKELSAEGETLGAELSKENSSEEEKEQLKSKQEGF